MITIYQANSSIDAKLIQDQLGFADIPSHIIGDLLQGGVGELQPQGLVKVMVDEEDFDKAKQVVENWEGQTIKQDKIKPRIESLVFPKQKSNKMVLVQLTATLIIINLLMKFVL
jgi:glutamate synthase domain-containing protein 3